MQNIKEYERILKEQPYLALATVMEGRPNVRVVNYYPDLFQKNVLYIRTNKHKSKVTELQENPNVSFTTLIKDRYEYIRVHNARVVRCEDYQEEGIKAAFLAKDPKFIDKMGKKESPYLYAIIFETASVTLNPVDSAVEICF